MTVYNGINGKITMDGAVIGSCQGGKISVNRNVKEYHSIGSAASDIVAGVQSVTWQIDQAWIGSTFFDKIKAGSKFNITLEITGVTGCNVTASGCVPNTANWELKAGDVIQNSLTGLSDDYYKS